MGINKQVFGSNSERSNFYKLSRQWGSSYRIYHNLPFLMVCNTKELINAEKLRSMASLVDPNEPITLSISDTDKDRLKKTSIDYTLCDRNDKPLVCIEFDGLKDGFNLGTEYRFDGPPDPWRERITGLKLRVAHGSWFPYFVVGVDHFQDLSDNIQLTMVDGIIGQVLSSLEAHDRVNQGFDPKEIGWTQEDFDNLPPDEQQEFIGEWLTAVEFEAELKNNPITIKVFALEKQIPLHCACTPLVNPVSTGCRCTLNAGTFIENGRVTYLPCKWGPITVTVWLPNFNTPGCTSVLGLVENLAKLAALEKARKLMKQQR